MAMDFFYVFFTSFFFLLVENFDFLCPAQLNQEQRCWNAGFISLFDQPKPHLDAKAHLHVDIFHVWLFKHVSSW